MYSWSNSDALKCCSSTLVFVSDACTQLKSHAFVWACLPWNSLNTAHQFTSNWFLPLVSCPCQPTHSNPLSLFQLFPFSSPHPVLVRTPLPSLQSLLLFSLCACVCVFFANRQIKRSLRNTFHFKAKYSFFSYELREVHQKRHHSFLPFFLLLVTVLDSTASPNRRSILNTKRRLFHCCVTYRTTTNANAIPKQTPSFIVCLPTTIRRYENTQSSLSIIITCVCHRSKSFIFASEANEPSTTTTIHIRRPISGSYRSNSSSTPQKSYSLRPNCYESGRNLSLVVDWSRISYTAAAITKHQRQDEVLFPPHSRRAHRLRYGRNQEDRMLQFHTSKCGLPRCSQQLEGWLWDGRMPS